MTNDPQIYTIELHRHNYARWCAARAYGRGLKGGGNQTAFDLIEACGLHHVTTPEHIGADVDCWLLDLMREILHEAKRQGISTFSFGHAQKLVNIYLKTLFVCGGYHRHPAVVSLHPPLDFQLFRGLKSFLRENPETPGRIAFKSAQAMNASWQKFTEQDYVSHIEALKLIVGDQPLFMAEEHWRL